MPFFEMLASVSWISIVLFIIGIGLLIVEMFEPGFGFFGVFGVWAAPLCVLCGALFVAGFYLFMSIGRRLKPKSAEEINAAYFVKRIHNKLRRYQ